MEKAFFASRYGKGNPEDYLNLPMTKEEYDVFYKELVNARMAELHDFGILPETFPLQIVSNALLWVTAVLCVISGVIYVKQSIKIIDFSK
jgi:hypothetical protein